MIFTFLVSCIDAFAHLLFAVCVDVHVGEDAGLVGPQVIVGAEEVDGELAHVVPHALDVFWDGFGMADLCWPPPRVREQSSEIILPCSLH